MSDVTREQVVDYLSNLSVMDLADLVSTLEDKWGVSAAAAVAVAAAPAADGGAAAVEQTEFTVVLESFGEKKIQVIKAIREVLGLGLKEAKALVESAPCDVKADIEKEEADSIKEKLEGAGASVNVK